MLNIAVVDDLREDRERLTSDIEAYFAASQIDAVCRAFSSGGDFLRAHAEAPFQLAILDICMESQDGISLSRQVRRTDAEVLIVFVSSSREYAFDAFPVHPFDYLVKPYDVERLRGVLGEAMRTLAATEGQIDIRVPRADMRLPLSRLSSVVAQGHAVEVTLTDGQRLRSIMTFAEIAERLERESRFLLVNRGVLVNMDDVLSLQGDTLQMKTGDRHPLRTRGRGALISAFTQYQIEQMRKESRPWPR